MIMITMVILVVFVVAAVLVTEVCDISLLECVNLFTILKLTLGDKIVDNLCIYFKMFQIINCYPIDSKIPN